MKARAALREVCFVTGRHHKLPSIGLGEWLHANGFAPPEAALVPLEITAEGVGDAIYYQSLGAICAALKPSRIVEFGTFVGLGTSSMAMNCEAQILTIDLPAAAKGVDIETLN